jgi:hypothetical protein
MCPELVFLAAIGGTVLQTTSPSRIEAGDMLDPVGRRIVAETLDADEEVEAASSSLVGGDDEGLAGVKK